MDNVLYNLNMTAEFENHNEEFREAFGKGLDDLLNLLEVAGDTPLPVDPSSMGVDERTFEELSEAEKKLAQGVIYERLGLDPDKLPEAKVRDYTTQAPEQGEIQVTVFRTNNEELFLQELTFADGEKRYMLGPDQDI